MTKQKTRRPSALLRLWPLLPLVLLVFSLPTGAVAAVFIFLFLIPGYTIWCGIGVLLSLSVINPPDKDAALANGIVGVLAGIPFVLIVVFEMPVHF